MWPTVGFGDAEIGEQERRGLGSHGTTTVGMQGQLAGRRGMFGGGIIEQCREHGGAFSVGDAPADDSAAEDIDDDVEVEVGPFGRPHQLRDVPRPDLVGCSRQQLRLFVNRMAQVIAAIADFLACGQDAVHGADRAVVGALVEQAGVDFGGCLIGKARRAQKVEHSLSFHDGQRTLWARSGTTHGQRPGQTGALAVRCPRASPQRALTIVERQTMLDLLRAPRFADQAPAEVYASLLDEGAYHCSIRTMYRILAASQEVRDRRDHLRHPIYKKPELLARAPNEVWSWDITKLMGPAKWTYFYLYVIIDIFSRRIVGWCVADRESATVFTALFNDATAKHPAPPGQLTLHADRGGPMRAKATALLLADLGVTKSHSRPHTSNDNPFSESHFKTMKYQPQFPQRFGCIQDAKAFCRNFFDWYNQEHHHAGIGLMTPDQVHYGQADAIHAARQNILDGAFNRNPERFVRKEPEPPAKPIATWINPPLKTLNIQA